MKKRIVKFKARGKTVRFATRINARTRKRSAKDYAFARCPICHNLQFVKKNEVNAWIARHVKAVHGRE